jgi:hypothetical protein
MLIGQPICGISLDASASLLVARARPSTTSWPEHSFTDEYHDFVANNVKATFRARHRRHG